MYIIYICVNTSDQSWVIMWNKMRSRLAYVCSYYLRMCFVFTPCLLFTVGPHGTPDGMAFGLPDKKHDARLPDKNCRVCVLMFTGSAVLLMFFVSFILKYLIDISLLRGGLQFQVRYAWLLVHQWQGVRLPIDARTAYTRQASPTYCYFSILQNVFPSQCVWHVWLRWLTLATKRSNTIRTRKSQQATTKIHKQI